MHMYTHTFPVTDLHAAQPQRGQDAAAASILLGYRSGDSLHHLLNERFQKHFIILLCVNVLFSKIHKARSPLPTELIHSKVTGLYSDFCFMKMYEVFYVNVLRFVLMPLFYLKHN